MLNRNLEARISKNNFFAYIQIYGISLHFWKRFCSFLTQSTSEKRLKLPWIQIPIQLFSTSPSSFPLSETPLFGKFRQDLWFLIFALPCEKQLLWLLSHIIMPSVFHVFSSFYLCIAILIEISRSPTLLIVHAGGLLKVIQNYISNCFKLAKFYCPIKTESHPIMTNFIRCLATKL